MDTFEQLTAALDPVARTSDATRRFGVLDRAPRVTCADGFTVSVQAGECLYCSPRDNAGPWVSVECGFPSEASELLAPYAEDPSKPTETVYGYVPIRTVVALIDEHGGFAEAPPTLTGDQE